MQTQDRDTPRIDRALGYASQFVIKAGIKLFAGIMVVLDTVAGEIEAGVGATADRICLGVNEKYVDNTDGGELSNHLMQGIYRFENKVGDELTKADIGSPCYIEDDITVMKTAGADPVKAGIVHDVDSVGVWVDFRQGRI